MSLEQEGYQFFSDDGSQAVATALASQDTGISSALNTSFRLRTLINSTATVPSRSAFRLEYKESAAPDYSPVSSSGGAIVWALSSNIASSGEATTQRLGTPSGKVAADFVTGRIWDDENGTDTISSMASAQNFTELEWCLQANSSFASAAQVYSFRVTQFPYTSQPVALDTVVGALSTSGLGVASGNFVVGSNSNKILVALVSTDVTGITCSSVSYSTGSGGAWSLQGTFTNGIRHFAAFTSVAPSNGTVNIAAGTSGTVAAGDCVVNVYSFYNSDQSVPADGFVTVASSTATMSTTLATNGYVVALGQSSGDFGTITTGTERYTATNNEFWKGASNNASGTISYPNGANARGMIGLNVRPA